MNGEARAISEASSNTALGGLLLALGAAVLMGYAGGLRDFASAEFYPALVALGMLMCGAALIAAAYFGGRLAPVRWTWLQLVVVTLVTAAILIALALYFVRQFLAFGPPEYAATILMLYALALALARRSHLRALGMMLIGLLLATVGVDVVTGRMRFTFGSETLFDGLDFLVLAPGLILVADGLICLISPARWLSTFTWLSGGWQKRDVSGALSVVLRVGAAVVVAACVWLAYNVHFRIWDIVLLALAAAFGIAAKFLGWNRAVLLIAFYYSAQLEQSLRNSLLLAKGSPSVFFERPYSLFHMLAAVALIVFTFALWLWRVRRAKS
jgi:TctA family transporter